MKLIAADGSQSRYASLLRINWPLVPDEPTAEIVGYSGLPTLASSLGMVTIRVIPPADYRSVAGFEIRPDNNYLGARKDWLADSDLELPVELLSLQSVGPVAPTGAANWGVGVSWVNPTGARASDDVYASLTFVNQPQESKALALTGFNFSSIADVDRIGGVEIALEGHMGPYTGLPMFVQLVRGGQYVGLQKSFSTSDFGSSDTIITLGGPSDAWGISTLTGSDVKLPSFGVGCWVYQKGTAQLWSVSLDAITMTVHYLSGNTPPSAYYVRSYNLLGEFSDPYILIP